MRITTLTALLIVTALAASGCASKEAAMKDGTEKQRSADSNKGRQPLPGAIFQGYSVTGAPNL